MCHKLRWAKKTINEKQAKVLATLFSNIRWQHVAVVARHPFANKTALIVLKRYYFYYSHI